MRGVDAHTFTLTDASGAAVPAGVDQIGDGAWGLFPDRIRLRAVEIVEQQLCLPEQGQCFVLVILHLLLLPCDRIDARLVGINCAGWCACRCWSCWARLCRRIEDVMAAYDRLQEALGGDPRYEQVLEQLGARPEPGASSPAPSD